MAKLHLAGTRPDLGVVPSRHSSQVCLHWIGSGLTVGRRKVAWEPLQRVMGNLSAMARVTVTTNKSS